MPAPQNLVQLKVRGLFGRFDYDLPITRVDSPIAILTAPNGYGKTHLLHIIDAIARQDYQELSQLHLRLARNPASRSIPNDGHSHEHGREFGNLPDGAAGTVAQYRAETTGQCGRTPSMGGTLGECRG